MDACDSLEPLMSGDNIDDDDPNPARSSAPYDDNFYSCADRVFNAISCHCSTSVELRLRLGMFRSMDPPKKDRSIEVLVQGKDETEQFWLTICLHCSPRPMCVVLDSPHLALFHESNSALANRPVKMKRATSPLREHESPW